MGPTWVLSAPDGPHIGPMNLSIRGYLKSASEQFRELISDSPALRQANQCGAAIGDPAILGPGVGVTAVPFVYFFVRVIFV